MTAKDALRVEDARDYRHKPSPSVYFVSGKDARRDQGRKQSRSSIGESGERGRNAVAHEHLRSLADAYAHNEESTSVEVKEVTQEEVIEEMRQDARVHLNMTFEEFRDAYRNGTLPDTLAANELAITLRFAGLTGEV